MDFISERQVAQKFREAAIAYADNPTAFYLRDMNPGSLLGKSLMLYEGLKSNATIIVVPSSVVESMLWTVWQT